MSAVSVCRSDSGLNAATAARSSGTRSNGPLLTGSWSAPAREPSSSCSTSLASEPARSAIVCTALRRSASVSLSHRLASVLAKPCTTVIGVRSSWLVVARNRSLASSSSLAAVTSRKSTTCSSRSSTPVHSTSSQRPFASLQVSLAPGSGTGNGGGLPAACAADTPVSAVRGRVPLPDQAVAVQHGDAVRAGVDDRALVRPLPDDFLERGRVRQRHAGVPGQQLEQFQLDVADLAPAVQGVQRAVRAGRHVRQAQRDRVQAGQRRPDQVVEAAGLRGGHHARSCRTASARRPCCWPGRRCGRAARPAARPG